VLAFVPLSPSSRDKATHSAATGYLLGDIRLFFCPVSVVSEAGSR